MGEMLINLEKLSKSKLFLAFLVMFGFLVRIISFFSIYSDGKITFLGADAFYHVRRVIYTVQHFPNTITFDPYINFPYGYEIGWPPLYDQTIAALALLIGGGNPDIATIEMVAAIFPVILGTLTIIAIYYVASSAFDKKTAILSAAIISLIPVHIMITEAGAADHHCAEVLLSTTAFALFMLSMKYSRETELSIKGIKETDKKLLLKPIALSIAAGIILALTIFTWVGAPIFPGLLLIFALAQFTFDLKEKRSSIGILFNVIITYITILLLIIPFIGMGLRPGLEMSGMFLSNFQIIYVIFLILATAVIGSVAEIFAKKDVKWAYYPVLIIAVGIIGLVLTKIAVPDFYQQAIGGIQYLSGSGGVLNTISEAQPILFDNGSFTASHIWNTLTIFSLTGIIGMLLSFAELNRKKYPAEMSFFVIWTIIVFVLTLLQRRFTYMLAINFAVLSAYTVKLAYDSWKDEQKDEKKTKKRSKKKPERTPLWEKASSAIIISLFAIVISIFAFYPLVETLIEPGTPPADWQEELHWLEANTPQTSYYFEQGQTPEYGVLSWWDYGNWIVYIAKRPVVANNFQTGLEDTARFYVTSDEAEAASILDDRSVRYVITDTSDITGKLRSIYQIAGEEFQGVEQYNDLIGGDESLRPNIIKLHLFSGNNLGNLRLIHESRNTDRKINLVNSTDSQNSTAISNIKIFEYVPGATIYGLADSNEVIYAKTNVTLSSGRTFGYHNKVTANESGWYEITVPYSSTGTPYDSIVESYSIISENTDKQEIISVDENDISQGTRIRLDLIQE